MSDKKNDFRKQNSDTMDYSNHPYYDDSHGYNNQSSPVDIDKALIPLIRQIHEYDSLRLMIEERGGHINYLNRISESLSRPFIVTGEFHPHQVSLMDHTALYCMLNDVGDYDFHLAIRQLDTGMPVYYLCRTRQDYWAEYSLIVQDLYKSPGYPMNDERFVKLMHSGHEVYYLRLSPFRQAVAGMISIEEESAYYSSSPQSVRTWDLENHLQNNNDAFQERIDSILYTLGRHIFQAAWHEDQQLGITVAECFGLNNFRYCIELLYLCLNAELCELRLAVSDMMLQFFDVVYPQPIIQEFLTVLTGLDGRVLNDIPQKALNLYTSLSKAFSRFLGIKVIWGTRKVEIPFYKLLYGNFTRMELIGKALKDNTKINKGAAFLEAEAEVIINQCLSIK